MKNCAPSSSPGCHKRKSIFDDRKFFSFGDPAFKLLRQAETPAGKPRPVYVKFSNAGWKTAYLQGMIRRNVTPAPKSESRFDIIDTRQPTAGTLRRSNHVRIKSEKRI